jgi:hypothetical protein
MFHGCRQGGTLIISPNASHLSGNESIALGADQSEENSVKLAWGVCVFFDLLKFERYVSCHTIPANDLAMEICEFSRWP